MWPIYCTYNIKYTMSLLKLWRQNPKSWFAWRYIKTCGRCFRMTLQNSLTIFDNVLLWTPYKSLMLCHPSSLPKLCNDIAIISWTGTVTLKQVSYFLKYGSNLSHKTLNVIRTCYSRSFPNFFSPSTNPTTTGLQLLPSILDSICSSPTPHNFVNQAQNCKFFPLSLQN